MKNRQFVVESDSLAKNSFGFAKLFLVFYVCLGLQGNAFIVVNLGQSLRISRGHLNDLFAGVNHVLVSLKTVVGLDHAERCLN